MWEIDKVTIPPCPKTRHANATLPRNVTSSTMVSPAPMINLSSASPAVEESDGNINQLQHVLPTTFCKAVDSPLFKQILPMSQ